MIQRNDEERDREQLQALGLAIRSFRGDRSQAELGALLGVPQTTISRWEAGLVDLGVTQVREIEEALNIRLGTLAYLAGFNGITLDDVEDEAFRYGVFGCLHEALDGLLAAGALNLGVRLSNQWSEPDEFGDCTIEWVLALSTDAPEA